MIDTTQIVEKEGRRFEGELEDDVRGEPACPACRGCGEQHPEDPA